MKLNSRKTLCFIILFLVAARLSLQVFQHADSSAVADAQADSTARTDAAMTRQAPEGQAGKKAAPARALENQGGIWKTGQPGPRPSVARGANNQRQFSTAVTRKLPDVIVNSTPSIMAMIPADGREVLLPEEIDEHTLKSRRMVLDTSSLDRIVNGESNRLLAPTPGNEVLDLKIEKIRTRTKQTHSLIGKIAGEELSAVNIVYHDGIVHGTVARYDTNQHFEYRILPDGHMMVRELDVASIPWRCGKPDEGGEAADNAGADQGHSCGPHCSHGDGEITIAPVPKSVTQETPVESSDTSGWTTIDVVVGYGALARSNQGGVSAMEAHIISAVDRMTNAFANSQVTNTELMLLGTIEDPSYTFPGNNANEMGGVDELGDLGNVNDGSLDDVTDYATTLGADLVSFVCDSSQAGTAGIANRPGRYSITARTAMSSYSFTFSHELGHNLGAKHSWGDSGDTTTNTSRYGLRFSGSGGSRYRTIMAYNNSPSYSASRIPHFANTHVNYDGTPTGLADGSDQTGNGNIDPVYISGGFDGTNPNLGARNGEMFLVQSGSNGVLYASNRSTRTALGVTSPTTGLQWAAGSVQTISFTGGDMDYTADIDLYQGGVFQYTIADDIEAIDHSFSWSIPLAQNGGNNFTIRVTLNHKDDPISSYAESPNFVIQGTNDLILNTPIGGEIWTRNTVQNITWSSSYGGNVSIEYIKGGGSPVTIVASTPDDGSYEWTIPYDFTTDNDYIIRITSDVSPFDTSQSASSFSVVAPSNTILSENLNTDPGFTTSGVFEFGVPGGNNDADSANTGANIYDTELDARAFSASTLTTPALDCSNYTNIILEFYAHVYVHSGYTVSFEISTDGTNWTTLYSEDGMNARNWNRYSYDITSIAAGESTVYVRWAMSDGGTQWPGGGLAIDDITITGDFIPADNVSLTSPNGGESWVRGGLKPITWVSSMPGNVDIELFKGGVSAGMIATDTPNDGQFNWLLPASLTAGSDYRVRVTSSAQASRMDESDSDFEIVVPGGAFYTENLDTDPGYTTSGQFQYGSPSGNNRPGSAQTGSNMYDTILDGTAYFTGSLQSIAIDCSSYENVSLRFWSHIYITNNYQIVFEVSNNNSTWHNLYTSSGAITNNSWTQRNYDISDWADGQPTVYIRWSMNNPTETYSQYGGGGLAIDDISLSGDFIPSQPTYDSWAAGPAVEADSNGDGVQNGIAWVLGAASPSASANSLLPTVDSTSEPGYMIFNYRRADEAHNDPKTAIEVEYGSDLLGWTTAVHDNDNVKISMDDDFYGTGIDRVQVKLKQSLDPGGRLFSRLKVTVTE